MSLFDAFFSGNNSNTADHVVLNAGTEEVKVPANEAQGKTLQQLFAQYAEQLGIDVERINRFVDAGRVVPGTTQVQLGRVYSGAVNSESKG